MAVTVTCSNCSASLKLKDRSKVGKKIICPKCGEGFVSEAAAGDDWDDSEPAPSRTAPRVRAGGTKSRTNSRTPASSGGNGNAWKVISAVIAAVVLIGGGLFAAGVFSKPAPNAPPAQASNPAPSGPAVSPAAPATTPAVPAQPAASPSPPTGPAVASSQPAAPAQPSPTEKPAPSTPPVPSGAAPVQGEEAERLAKQAMTKWSESMASGDVASIRQSMASMQLTRDQCHFLFGDLAEETYKIIQKGNQLKDADLAQIQTQMKAFLMKKPEVKALNYRDRSLLSFTGSAIVRSIPDRYPVFRVDLAVPGESNSMSQIIVLMENNEPRALPLLEIDYHLEKQFKARTKPQ